MKIVQGGKFKRVSGINAILLKSVLTWVLFYFRKIHFKYRHIYKSMFLLIAVNADMHQNEYNEMGVALFLTQ